MGVGGVELPTGTFDHQFGKGALGEIAAGLFSLEKKPGPCRAYFASGVGRTWNFTTFGLVPLPPSWCHGVYIE